MKLTEDISVFKEDNLQLLSSLKDQSQDLGVVDTPFGINEGSKNHESRNTPVLQKNGSSSKIASVTYSKKDWDSSIPSFQYWAEMYRVCINFMCFGANYFPEIVGIPFKPIKRSEFSQFIKDNPKHWVIWDKCNGSNDFNDCDMIYCTREIDSIVVKHVWAGMMQGANVVIGNNNAITEGNKKLNEKRIHPTQKPVKLYEWLLLNYAKKGFKILDTHLGSGSIAIACHRMGLELTAIEIDDEYFGDFLHRFEAELSHISIIGSDVYWE